MAEAVRLHSAHPCASPLGQRSCAKRLSLPFCRTHFVSAHLTLGRNEMGSLGTPRSFLAEAVRFELTIGLPRCRFSRPVHSTTLPRFRNQYGTDLSNRHPAGLYSEHPCSPPHWGQHTATRCVVRNCSRQFRQDRCIQPLCHASERGRLCNV